MIREPRKGQSQSGQKPIAPWRIDWDRAHTAYPDCSGTGSGHPTTAAWFRGWEHSRIALLAILTARGMVRDCSTAETPAKCRYFLTLIFLQFGPALGRSWAPHQMCPFEQIFGEWSGNTPGPIQRPHLITAFHLLWGCITDLLPYRSASTCILPVCA